jgi:hypothetical protein
LQSPLREPLAPTFLKHPDDQTVVGLAAVFDAIKRHQLNTTDFHGWSVVCAPRFLGRIATAAAIQRFAKEGAWGISPHHIPHFSLHSPSGTISLALKSRGPNLGVGGGPNSASEAIYASLSLLAEPETTGVWVVFTGWQPEVALQPTDERLPVCRAAALALAPDRPDWTGTSVAVTRPSAHRGMDHAGSTCLDAETIFDLLTMPCQKPASWRLAGDMALDWEPRS